MWFLVGIILIMPLERNPYFYLSSNFLGIFPDFTLIKLLGLLGTINACVMTLMGRVRLRLLQSPQVRYFALFVMVVIISGLMNGAVMRPLTRLISIMIFLPVVLATANREEQLLTAIKAAPMSLIVIFPYALRQYFRFGGRLGVGLSEPNYLALGFILLLPLAFVFARHEKVSWKKGFWVVGTLLMFVAIILTGSRGGLIGFLVSAFFLVVKLTKRRLLNLIAGACAVVVTLFVIPNPLLDRLRDSGLGGPSQNWGIEYSNRARKAELKGGLRMLRERPLTGVGLGNFKEKMEEYDLGAVAIAHNTYLQVGAELGLPALLTYILVMIATYRSLGRSVKMAQRRDSAALKGVALAMQAGLLGYLGAAVFLSAQFEKFLWLSIFLTINLERVLRAMPETRAEHLVSQRLPPDSSGASRWLNLHARVTPKRS